MIPNAFLDGAAVATSIGGLLLAVTMFEQLVIYLDFEHKLQLIKC